MNEEIYIDDIENELKSSIKKITSNDKNILTSLFTEVYDLIKFHFSKLINFHNSELIISNGINNQIIIRLLKIYIESFLNIDSNGSKYIIKEIEFNCNINSTEDYIFGELINMFKTDSSKKTKTDFINNQKVIIDYFQNLEQILLTDNRNNDQIRNSFFIIYFRNIDNLFNSKKQSLFYSLLEILFISKNVLIIGCSYNFNLIDSLEKRVKSRFIHTSIHPSINSIDKIYNSINIIFSPSEVKKFSIVSLLLTNLKFNNLLQKYYDIGYSSIFILTKLKKLLCDILFDILKIKSIKKEDESISINLLKEVIEFQLNLISNQETEGSNYEMLKNLTSFHLICIISVISVKKKQKYFDRIKIDSLYKEYLEFSKISKRTLIIDILQFKKRLEELKNCNIISISYDDKHGEIYDIKLPDDEMNDLFDKLYKEKTNFDNEMFRFYKSIK